ncbi:hypothetical protein FFJ24_017040 [Pedobacter sp. KBS0701]|uniref:hypothetical protein n=1 Tax=Pedobacter sp. KBS0701 TaxID=2578106 RepID=UPI00110DF014|nr:hypothetical protein [Pedobacter sp. KBS0701]QDW26429.1 hypothetical protein FFJ24_017040 [Pedobacter sp. KBS0701]
MIKALTTALLIAVFFISNKSIAQNPSGYDTIMVNSVPYAELPKQIKYFVDRNRNNFSFNEDISSSVFLSKASFAANKRWMTKSDFSDRKSLILDAKISPYINISPFNWTINLNKEKESYLMFALYFNPEFEVRIFNNDKSVGDSSLPVRTASSRPGGELFITHSALYKKDRSHNFGFSVKGYHHSNGQDGEEFNSTDKAWGKKGYFNTYNGNFSDDFVVEFNGIMFLKNASNTLNQYLKFGYGQSSGLAPGMKKYNIYGTNRLNLFYTYKWSTKYGRNIVDHENRNVYNVTDENYPVEKLRIEFFASFITNSMNVGPIYNLSKATFRDRINFHSTLHYRIRGFSAAGLFVEGGYYGQDTYNAYFQRSAWFAKAGLSFGLFTYPKHTDDLK